MIQKFSFIFLNLSFNVLAATKLNKQDRLAKKLHLAIDEGENEAIDSLIVARANVNFREDCNNCEECTILTCFETIASHLCITKKNPQALRSLLRAKADPKAVAKSRGLSVLQYAVQRRDEEAVRALVEAKSDLEQEDKDHCTALAKAFFCCTSNRNIQKILLDAGANINVKGVIGSSILNDAKRYLDNEAEIQRILECKADPEYKYIG